ncbi:hypothetical protein TIFTF001_015245 [Ficus carica]|uniref:Vacuolar sorting protein 39/Transforming growth factor beta receptor-associated zinc finger domain-containing protein n=1 Tax=Ficus carica TaxID=3494 RepID=A0AA88A442_FICCA|nr:hypothetical protein TIFTF001_015245 [Ficus carica]
MRNLSIFHDHPLEVSLKSSASKNNNDEVISAIDPSKIEIFQRYLQWLIEEQDFSDTRFHTIYALSLAKSTIEAFEEETNSQNPGTGRMEGRTTSDPATNLIFQIPVRERLQIFLQSSDLYDAEEILDLIEGSELWWEKAILYRKLGQETLVLQILALKLEDSDAAEQYCAEIGRPDAYMQLLDMYLNPQDGKEPMFKAAVRLLHNHGESLDPLQVLERLSQDMPLQLASETLLRMLRARLHHHRQGQIVHNLSRALDTDARLARLEERSRHVQINDESLCDSCHARLGTKLFAMYPDDTVVCYKCFRRQGESTSVTGRNFKRDILVKPGIFRFWRDKYQGLNHLKCNLEALGSDCAVFNSVKGLNFLIKRAIASHFFLLCICSLCGAFVVFGKMTLCRRVTSNKNPTEDRLA